MRAIVKVQQFLWVMALCLSAIAVSGCKPEFNETSCLMDSDCFGDEYCSPTRQCLIRTSASLYIDEFQAMPSSVKVGESVTISWETRGGKSATITGPDAFSYEVPSASLTTGELELDAFESEGEKTYTLTLAYDAFEKSEDVSVTVTPRDLMPPTVDSFESDADTVDAGELVRLSWSLTGATSAEITGGIAPVQIGDDDLASGTADVNPMETTTYTITATNEDGMASSSQTVTVVPLPEPTISSFSASAESIILGDAVTLSWVAMDGESLSIVDEDSNEVFSSSDTTEVTSGSTALSPAQTTTYTLNVLNSVGSATAGPVEVSVIVAPTITSFTASQETDIVPGANIDLSWETVDADTVEIRDQESNLINSSTINSGTFSVAVTQNSTYTLLAINSAGIINDTVSVSLLGSPVINTFTASKEVDVLFNESIELGWDVSLADSIEIRDQDDNLVISSASLTSTVATTVTESTTYTLTAINGAGSVTETVSVAVLDPPTLVSFAASQETDIVPGANIDLSWESMGADSIEIRDQESNLVTSSTMNLGSFTVAVPQTTTYTLTAINGAGSVSNSVTAVVLVVPSITSFTSDVGTTQSGGLIELSWTTQDANSLVISDDQGSPDINVQVADVASGSARVFPQVGTVYTLTAIGAGMGNQVTSTVTVSVSAAPLLITEVLYSVMAPESNQWVEIYNTGDTFVQLSHYSLGWSGTLWASHTQALSPKLLAPGEVVVVGDLSGAVNYNPIVDLVAGFVPALSDGSVQGDGVALFFSEAQNITATTTPVDSVIWGADNANGLLDESGVADTELSPLTMATSLVRVSPTSDVFVDSGAGFPNTPFYVSGVQPMAGPNTAEDAFTVMGYGFDPVLDDYTLGTTPLSCTGNSTMLTCTLDLTNPSTDTGSVGFIATRSRGYVFNPQGMSTVAPAVTSYSYELADAFIFSGRALDPDNSFECSTMPVTVNMVPAGTPVPVTVKLFAQGSTETPLGMLPAGWQIQASYVAPGVAPFETMSLDWVTWDMATNVQMDDPNNSDNELFDVPVVSMTPFMGEVVSRISKDGGLNWIYCNAEFAGGSSTGWTQGAPVTWN